jgi:hypothetical protein
VRSKLGVERDRIRPQLAIGTDRGAPFGFGRQRMSHASAGLGKVSQWGFWSGLAAPFVLACGAYLAGPTPRGMADAGLLPALAFDQYQVDLREVSPTERVSAYFAFRNHGSAPVRVTKLVPSCGCLQPYLKKRLFEAGETGEFLLSVQTANQNPGAKEYRVTVHYEDPEPREQDVVFKVVLPANQVLVRPASLTFYQLGHDPIEQEIVVTDLRARPLDVLGVRCTSEYAKVELLPPEETVIGDNEPKRIRMRVTVDAKIPPGRQQALITIFTDDEKYSELRVPLRIQGPSGKGLPETASQPPAADRRRS